MRMVLTEDGWVKDRSIKRRGKTSTIEVVDTSNIEEPTNSISLISKSNKTYSFALPTIALSVATVTSEGGVFWDTFLKYIFPWLLDIAKVYCAIMIAKSFYDEKRGGRDSSTGAGSIIVYGKWLLLFHLIPWGVELIDQLGEMMWLDLKNTKVD